MDVPGDAVESFEVAFVPGVHHGWTVQVTLIDAGGRPADGGAASHYVADTVEVERMIAACVGLHGDEVASIVHTFGGRDIHLCTGSSIRYRWHLSVWDWRCLDCGIDTDAAGEYYMVLDEIWQRVNPTIGGHLCLACLESRLGRPLSASDFSDRPINTGPHPEAHRSPRLLALLGHEGTSRPAEARQRDAHCDRS